MATLARSSPARMQPVTLCIGRDPYCPCQDGDRCHYVADGATPAMPIPAPTVTLINGREVASDSREWLLETLARHILRRPLDVRRQWLADMERKGDKAGADELREAMRTVHEHRTERRA
jgi:hypothetical protein